MTLAHSHDWRAPLVPKQMNDDHEDIISPIPDVVGGPSIRTGVSELRFARETQKSRGLAFVIDRRENEWHQFWISTK